MQISVHISLLMPTSKAFHHVKSSEIFCMLNNTSGKNFLSVLWLNLCRSDVQSPVKVKVCASLPVRP